jgi:hypothetical protein
MPVPHFKYTEDGARSRNRTNDLLITNQLLCQLSYAGTFHGTKMGAGVYAKRFGIAMAKSVYL